MMSPDAIRSTGFPAASYHPYAIVSGVASRRCVLGPWFAAAASAQKQTTSSLRSIRTLYAKIRPHVSIARLRQVARAAQLVPRAADLVRRHGRPPVVLYFGEAPGDDLMATAVVAQWRKVRGTRPWYLTRHPGLFDNHPDVGLVLDYEPELAGALSLLGVPRVRLWYHTYDAATDRTVGTPGVHLINLMCASAGLPFLVDPAPLFHFARDERPPRAAVPRLVIQSSVMAARFPNLNKEWFADRMQQVVDALADEAEIVHIGAE